MPEPLLMLHQVTAGYTQQPIFADVDFQFARGQFAALVGPTGSGKTTLLKTILGLLPPTRGRITMAPRLTLGYVPQRDAIDWRFPVTVQQVVLMGRYRHTSLWPWATREDRQQAQALLERLGLADYATRHIGALSGGQQQRVFLARALISAPDLLLLDEPTTGVDMKTQHDILHLLHALHADGMSILLTTHDLNTVASHLPWVVCFNHGIVAQGTPEDVFTPALLRQTYDAEMVVIREGELTLIANRSLAHAHASRQGTLRHHRARVVRDSIAR